MRPELLSMFGIGLMELIILGALGLLVFGGVIAAVIVVTMSNKRDDR